MVNIMQEGSSSQKEVHSASFPSSPDVFLSEYKSARDRLPENVRAPLDILREEVMEICKAHGVDHPSKLVLAETHVSTETLERVQELLDQIHYIFEHQKLPPTVEKNNVPLDDQEYTVELNPAYERADISIPCDIHGGFIFVIKERKTRKRLVMDQNGQLVGDPEGYDEIWDLTDIGGKPAFIAKKEGTCCVVYDGKNIEEPKEYDDAQFLTDIGGHIGFFAYQKLGWFVFVNGRNIGAQEGYDVIEDFIDVGGKPAYTAQAVHQDDFFKVIVKDGFILGDEKEGYNDISHLVDIGGKLGSAVKKDTKWFVLLDEEVVGSKEGYDKVFALADIGGKIGYIAKIEEKIFFILDGIPLIELTEYYKDGNVDLLKDIGGKMACKINKGAATRAFYNGKVVEPRGIFDIVDVGGRMGVITATSLNNWIWFDGRCTSIHFSKIHVLHALDHDRFYVIAEDKGRIVKRVYSFSDPTFFPPDLD